MKGDPKVFPNDFTFLIKISCLSELVLKSIKMKRIQFLLLALGLILSVQSFSQVTLGVRGGANLSNMFFDIDSEYGEEPDTKLKPGLQFGLMLDVPLARNGFSMQPGLLFSQKGFSFDMEEMFDDLLADQGLELESYEGYMRVRLNYVELPVNFVFKMEGLQFFAGPYFAFGIGGAMTHDFKATADGETLNSSDIFDKDKYKIKAVYKPVDNDAYADFMEDNNLYDIYRGFDYGVNLGIGYQFDSFQVNLGYSYGLGNVTPNYDADKYEMDANYTKGFIQRNRVISLSLAYFFAN